MKSNIIKLKEISKNINDNLNKIINGNCLEVMKEIKNDLVDLTLTDIPYEFVNKKSNGLRKLDKEKANTKTFEIKPFLEEVFRITKGSGYIFCGKEQVSEIFDFFNRKSVSTRLMIWEKTNPSPMNCQYLWMSGIECFIYFKKKNGTFNEKYKNCVVRFPNGISKIHPTQKPIKLFEYLIKVSSNKNDIVFDPCIGSGTTAFACKNLERNFIGCEIEKEFCEYINNKLKQNITLKDFKEKKKK